MIVTSKNGLKLDIRPRHWWNILDWYETLRFAYDIRNCKVHINSKDWRYYFRSVKYEL